MSSYQIKDIYLPFSRHYRSPAKQMGFGVGERAPGFFFVFATLQLVLVVNQSSPHVSAGPDLGSPHLS